MDADDFAASAVGLHQRLVRVVTATCGDRALAEECAQEALVRAWGRVDGGDDLRSLEAWTIRVALNWCHSRRRRSGAEHRAYRRVAARPVVGPGEPTELLSSDVRAAVLALPRRQREVVVLHYLLDLDVAGIAEATGTSTGGVKNALFHGRASLAKALTPDANRAEPEEIS